jgi:hypothetical protein
MREKLNENPLAQVAIVGVLLVFVGFFVMSSMGGGKEEEAATPAPTEATVTVAGTGETGTATAASPGEAVEGAIETATATTSAAPTEVPPMPGSVAPPPPKSVTDAFEANQTVVLLFVRNGGIDDEIVKRTVDSLGGLGDLSTFIVPADRIARYASITQGVAVDRVPALVVITPKNIDGGIPVASVSYGFQSHDSVTQAVVDAGYQGRTLDYHP